jgi:RNA polymerase sigma-70 factor (ECF subfamily)
MPVMSEPDTLPETMPVSRAREGDAHAWSLLLARFRLPLYSFVYGWMRDEQTSIDIVQETFINAARHIATLREDSKFAGWLFNIAHQKCQQHWRKKKIQTAEIESYETALADESPDPGEWLIKREDEQRFMNLVDQLPLPQRAALTLHFIEDFSLEEIASITDSNLGTVKSRLHYAKKTLRKLLEDTPT